MSISSDIKIHSDQLCLILGASVEHQVTDQVADALVLLLFENSDATQLLVTVAKRTPVLGGEVLSEVLAAAQDLNRTSPGLTVVKDYLVQMAERCVSVQAAAPCHFSEIHLSWPACFITSVLHLTSREIAA